MWHNTAPHICPDHMVASTVATNEGEQNQWLLAMKACWGILWNTKLAYRYRMKYNGVLPNTHQGRCPLCGGEDGGGHITSMCTHAHIKSIIMDRHHTLVDVVNKYIATSKWGSSARFTDGHKASRTDLGNVMPDWLQPPGNEEGETIRYKPDIVLIKKLKANKLQRYTPHLEPTLLADGNVLLPLYWLRLAHVKTMITAGSWLLKLHNTTGWHGT